MSNKPFAGGHYFRILAEYLIVGKSRQVGKGRVDLNNIVIGIHDHDAVIADSEYFGVQGDQMRSPALRR
jgi:hypothetical protein